MSFWRRHRWNRRFLLGLAFAVMAVPAQAMALDSPSVLGEAVKTQSTAQPLVIPYLSHGLTVADATPVLPPDAIERALQAKFAADVTPVLPPDAVDRAVQAKLAAETPQVINYLSQGLTAADALDPRSGIPVSAGIPVAGDEFIVGLEATSTSTHPNDRPEPRPTPPDTRSPVATADGDGFGWDNGLTVALGALVLAFGAGIALMYTRRPRIAV
jgi:hypothetical protein